MNLLTVIALLMNSLLFTCIFVIILKSRGPWGSGWTFFTITCLWLAAVTLWIPPAGPIWGGVAWIDMFLTGLLVSFVMSATTIVPSSTSSASGKDLSKIAEAETEIQSDDRRLNRPNKDRMGVHQSSKSNTLVQISAAHASTHHSDIRYEDDIRSKTSFKTSNMFWLLLAFLFALIILGAS